MAFSSTHSEKSRNGLIRIVAALSVLRRYGEELCNLGEAGHNCLPPEGCVRGTRNGTALPPPSGGGVWGAGRAVMTVGK